MVARPGAIKTSFAAGELDRLLHARTELKYFRTGAKRMENVAVHPQGGFSQRDRLKRVGDVPATATRPCPGVSSPAVGSAALMSSCDTTD